MRRGAAVFVGAVLVAGAAVSAYLAVSWLGDAPAPETDSPLPADHAPEAPPREARPGREHVDRSTAPVSGVDGDSPPTVATWIAALCRDGTPLVRMDGSEAEWWHFPLDEVMAGLLDAIARDDIAWSASRAFDAVRSIGYLAAPWAQDVAPYLRDDTHAESARVTLAAMGPDAMPVVIGYLDDEDPRIRERALLVFAEADYRRREIVELAVAALDDPDGEVRAAAVEVLAFHTEAPGLSMPALAARVEDAAASGRLDVLHALALYGPDAAPAVPALVRLLGDPHARGKATAIDALRAVGPAARPAVPTLLDLVAQDAAAYAGVVPMAVVVISPDAFVEALSHDSPGVRDAMAGAVIGAIDARPELEAPIERTLVRWRDTYRAGKLYHESAASSAMRRALGQIEHLRVKRETRLSWARERLASLHPSQEGRVAVLESVRGMGPAVREVAPAVRALLSDSDPRVRLHAALAAWAIDPPANDVEPILRTLRDVPSLRGELYEGLACRPPASWAEHVVALLRDEPDPSPVLGPAYALVEAMGEDALDPLIRLAKEETRDQRLAWIATLLHGIGAPAVPTLRELADHPGLLPPIRAEILRFAETAR